jgi:GNAT superfamily N-acetyltransferase
MAFVMNQQKIDQWTCGVEPHPIGPDPKCDLCEKPEVSKLVSREIIRGRMFIVRHSSPAFDPDASLAFCSECWPRWLMWRARMGYDLHWEHASDAPCHAGCLARQGGRATQLAAQMSLLQNRPDGFFAQKSIDGQPRVNGSMLLMAMRMSRFMFRPLHRQHYYESISDPAEVQRQFLQSFQLRQLGVPRAQVDGMHIIVEAFESWYNAPGGDVGMPGPGDKSIGLHCVHLTHYSDSGAILGFWNCWGSAWGKQGHGTIPFEYLEKYLYEAFATRRGRFAPGLWNFEDTGRMPSRELRRRLLLEAPRERVRIRRGKGENWVLEIWETWSPATERRVMCFEVQNGFGLPMGWMFLRPTADGGVCEIAELFVWPTFRRMGIGRYLEDVARDYATSWGCEAIHLMMNEADAVIGPPRAAARLFGQALGYDWRWRADVAPRTSATGIKRVVAPV